MRLLKLDLVKFFGNYDKTPSFLLPFTSVMHYKTFLIHTKKFNDYLRGCLIGKAAVCIRDININNEEYELTWTSLETRYANLLHKQN